MRKGNRQELNLALRELKNSNGSPNFPALFDIPSVNRLPELAKQNYEDTLDIVVAGLTLAIENMNLKRGLSATQINDLAEEIVDTASDDNLSFEDLILFLQGLTRGRYGELYESMDIPKFMTMFDKYRDERWDEGVKIRDEKHLEYKSLGETERTNQPDPLAEHFANMAGRISDLRENLKYQKEVNKANRL